ncbi:MAG: hypothetical protein IJS15_02775, partial [Victivallales bacterium]|nr:hypothetical protein [Victivallales bacterium]
MKKTFESECEKLRYRALRDGSGSCADMSWRSHAKSCPECQASLHILELLNGHDDSGAYRLSPEQADKLVEKARERYGVSKPKTFMERLLGYSGKVAAVAVFLFGLSQLSSRYSVMGWMLDRSVNAVADTVLSVAAPEAHAEAENFAMSENFVTPALMALYAPGVPSANESATSAVEPRDMMQGFSPFESLDNAIGLV